MWKNRLLCLGLVLCLLLAGCSAQRGESESSQSSEPGSQSSESGSQTSEPVEEKPALPIRQHRLVGGHGSDHRNCRRSISSSSGTGFRAAS